MMHRGPRFVRGFAAALVAVVVTADSLSATSLLTREEALKLAYPGATFAAERVFLTDEQRQRVADAGSPVNSSLIARYIARQDGRAVGRAYVDTHMVRTKKETLLISLDASGLVKRVDTTAFLEPTEYQAPQPFLNQYTGKSLTEDLRLQRAIRPIAGATLTARAVTDAVRRVLAIDAVLR
jgi:Na+-translocating ferredoxin:NAD+ oxidoreductase subunit G